jgi:hypothetical protein
MEDLQEFEADCVRFGEYIASLDGAIAQYDFVVDFGNTIIMN